MVRNKYTFKVTGAQTSLLTILYIHMRIFIKIKSHVNELYATEPPPRAATLTRIEDRLFIYARICDNKGFSHVCDTYLCILCIQFPMKNVFFEMKNVSP